MDGEDATSSLIGRTNPSRGQPSAVRVTGQSVHPSNTQHLTGSSGTTTQLQRGRRLHKITPKQEHTSSSSTALRAEALGGGL